MKLVQGDRVIKLGPIESMGVIEETDEDSRKALVCFQPMNWFAWVDYAQLELQEEVYAEETEFFTSAKST